MNIKPKLSPKTNRAFTRSQHTASVTEYSKSALTDHANQANHTIDWKKITVIDREQDRPTRWIKEAVHIRKEGHWAMNRDEGSYQLSHAYDRFLDATADRRRLGRTEYQLLLMISWWDRNVKIRYVWLWLMNFNCIVIPTKWVYFFKLGTVYRVTTFRIF